MILWIVIGDLLLSISSQFLSLLLVSLALGLSNFVASIGIGLSGVDAQTRLKTVVVFGFFEAVMPLIGLLLGQQLAGWLGDIGTSIGAILLVIIGGYTLWQTRQPTTGHNGRQSVQRLTRLLITGFALSLDNLAVGFGLGFFHVPILLAALMIAAISVGMSLLGLELGRKLEKWMAQGSEVLAGVILILVGLALVFHLL